MLQKILDFFKSLFGGARSTTKPTTTTPPPTTDYPTSTLPTADETDPQDGSEITPDTAVVIVKETDPIVNTTDPVDASNVDGPDSPTEVIIEETEPTTTTEPDPEPDPVDTSTDNTNNNTSSDTNSSTSDTSTSTTTTTTTTTETPTELGDDPSKHKARFMWCLDNGHGKKTRGKRSPRLPDGRQLLEYEFNRDIVKRMTKILDRKGVKYFITVPEVDVDNFLEERVKRANDKASDLPRLFVSIHSNAAPAPLGKWSDPNISGVETWYYHNNSRGRKIAAIFQKHLVAANGWKNRHIKSRPTNQFYVLRNTRMTAILTENGFYNNKAQCLELFKDEVRERIAVAHVDAIMEIEKKGV